jgi:hypothetical protein
MKITNTIARPTIAPPSRPSEMTEEEALASYRHQHFPRDS